MYILAKCATSQFYPSSISKESILIKERTIGMKASIMIKRPLLR